MTELSKDTSGTQIVSATAQSTAVVVVQGTAPSGADKPAAPTLAGKLARKAGFYVAVGALVTGLSGHYLSGNDDPAKGKSIGNTDAQVAARDKLIRSYGGNPKNLASSKADTSFDFNASRGLQFGLLASFMALGVSGYKRLKMREILASKHDIHGFWNQMAHMDGLSGVLYGKSHAEHMANNGQAAFSRSVVATLENEARIAEAKANKALAEAKTAGAENNGLLVGAKNAEAKANKALAAAKLEGIEDMALSSWSGSLPDRWFPGFRNDRLAYSTVSEPEVEVVIKETVKADAQGQKLKGAEPEYEREKETATKYREYAKATYGESNGDKFSPPKKIPSHYYRLKGFN